MKRSVLFGSIFGAGLVTLALVAGPAHLFRDEEEPRIAPSDLGGVHAPIVAEKKGDQAQKIGVVLEGAGKLPKWEERTLPDGSKRRVLRALLTYRSLEPFERGGHLARPQLDLFPGLVDGEKPDATIEADGCDVATRGDLAGASPLASGGGGSNLNDRLQDVRALTLSPNVRVKKIESDGKLVLLETERLEAPEAPLDAAGRPQPPVRIVGPKATHFWRDDGGFDLKSGGFEVERLTGRVTLQPPLAITTQGLGPDAAGAAERPPVTIRCDGVTTFVPDAPPSRDGDAKRAGDDGLAALGLGGLVGPGELLFTQNVDVRQGDEQETRWLRTDRVRVRLARAADGRLFVEQIDGGVPASELAFGLRGGIGRARALHWSAPEAAATTGERTLVLDGPVALDDFVIGDGPNAKKLRLSARGRMTARELAADASHVPKLPQRWHVELEDGAHVELPDELVADGDHVVAELAPLAADAAKPAARGAGGMRLLFVRVEGTPATADLGERGRGRARTITLTEGDRDEQTAHLEGDARADFAQGFVAGESIDLTQPRTPDDPAAAKPPFVVVVPRLAAAELALPDGGGPFDAAFAGGDAKRARGGDAAPAKRLVIEPIAACALTSRDQRADLLGRARYRVRSADATPATPDLQTLLADECHLVPSGARRFDAQASGAVVLDDGADGIAVEADALRTEPLAGDARQLVVDGAPATIRFTLPPAELAKRRSDGAPLDGADARITARARHLVLDLASGALAADDEQRVTILVPDALLGALMPSLLLAVDREETNAAPADLPLPVTLVGEQLRFVPGAKESASANDAASRALPARLATGTLELRGRVAADRPADRSHLECAQLRFDLAAGSGRFDGDAAPVTLLRPRAYVPAGIEPRVDSVIAAWIRVEQHGLVVESAKGSRFVLHDEKPTPAEPLPPLFRIELLAGDEPRLEGRRLAFTGGVDLSLRMQNHRAADEFTTAHAHSERGELFLNQTLPEKGQLKPTKLYLTQRVRLETEAYRVDGSTLAIDLTVPLDDPERFPIELKEGVDRVAVRDLDENDDERMTMLFKRVGVRALLGFDRESVQAIVFDDVHLRLETRRGH